MNMHYLKMGVMQNPQMQLGSRRGQPQNPRKVSQEQQQQKKKKRQDSQK